MNDLQRKNFVIKALRRASYRWPPRSKAMANARRGRGVYECALCKKLHPRADIHLDHIEPVIPISGWTDYNVYVVRLLCDTEEWQVLCKPCHSTKTVDENSTRREFKNEAKKNATGKLRNKRKVRK